MMRNLQKGSAGMEKSKVFLGNPPWSKPGYYGVRAGSRWPHFESITSRYMPFPFMLAYAAAVLEQSEREVLLVDGIAERLSDEQFLEKISSFAPHLILLEVSSSSFPSDIRLIRKIRDMMDQDVTLALAGPHADMYVPEFLNRCPEVDLVLMGEYEYTLADVAQAMDTGQPIHSIPGLIARDEREQPIHTGTRPVVQDVDSFPWPARHFLPMNTYCDNPGGMPDPVLQMWASRGCPYRCTYCCWPHLMYNKTYRQRNIQDILEEMETACRTYNLNSVYFDDDTFNIGKKRMLEFCEAKKSRCPDLPWSIMARADLMDGEILEAMADCNLKGVKYGVESASPQLLKRVKKNLDLQKVKENIALTKKLGIRVHLTFMLGIPGETKQTVKDTVHLARQLQPHSAQFSLLTPIPGTELYQEMEANGMLETRELQHFDGYRSAVINTGTMNARDLEKALRYANFSWILSQSLHRLHPSRIRQTVSESATYLRHYWPRLTQVKG